MLLLKDEPCDYHGQWLTVDVRVAERDAINGIACYTAEDGTPAEWPVYRTVWKEGDSSYWYMNERHYRVHLENGSHISLPDRWSIERGEWEHGDVPGSLLVDEDGRMASWLGIPEEDRRANEQYVSAHSQRPLWTRTTPK